MIAALLSHSTNEFGDHLATEIFVYRLVDFWRRQAKDKSSDQLLEACLINNLVVVLLDNVRPLDELCPVYFAVQKAGQHIAQGTPRNQYFFYSWIFRQHILKLIEQPLDCS